MLGNLITSNSLIFLVTIQILLYCVFIKFKNTFIVDPHLGVQNTSYMPSPRIGGVLIIINIYLATLFLNIKPIFADLNIILFLIIIGVISVKEDIFGNVNPYIRLLSILICSFLFAIEYKYNLIFELELINQIFQNNYLYIIIITLSLTAFPNGLNIIDGMNGLVCLSLICIVSSLLIISQDNINNTNNILSILLIFLFVFLIFNFPKGYIFFGDSGCYLIGWALGIFIIDMYANNVELSIWNIILICSYPSFEVIFSYFRKIFEGKSPFQPDKKHIHLKTYYFLKERYINDLEKKNYIVTIILLPLWAFPTLFTYLIYIGFLTPKIFLLIQILIYTSYYLLIPETKKT